MMNQEKMLVIYLCKYTVSVGYV